jgi:hypothetical protein
VLTSAIRRKQFCHALLELIVPMSISSILDLSTRVAGEPDNLGRHILRSVGVPENMIEYVHSLVIHPINYHSCFISYSSNNEAFAEHLYTDLQSKGVRYWFAPEDMKIGDKIRPVLMSLFISMINCSLFSHTIQ